MIIYEVISKTGFADLPDIYTDHWYRMLSTHPISIYDEVCCRLAFEISKQFL